jgi:hypothetical protein
MFTDWIPAISSTSLLAIVMWLCRNLITEHLKNSVKHDYDKKIETIRADLRIKEDSFKSDLKAKESQIDSLRTGALSGIISRQEILYQDKKYYINAKFLLLKTFGELLYPLLVLNWFQL